MNISMNPAGTARKAAPPRSRRPRKSTYVVRRDEIARLEKQVEILRAQVAHYSSDPHNDARNSILDSAVRDHQANLTGLQALLGAQTVTQQEHPIYRPLHLPMDQAKRRRLMWQWHPQKLDDVRRYLLERRRGLDLTKSYATSEHFESANGDMCVLRFDVSQLPHVINIRQLATAGRFYAQFAEIELSEKLNAIIVREDDESHYSAAVNVDVPLVAQRRMVAKTSVGVSLDINSILFREYAVAGQNAIIPEEHIAVCLHPVETDERFPYQTAERVRQDMMTVVLITAATPPAAERGSENTLATPPEPVVTVTRCMFARTHCNGDAVDGAVGHALAEEASRWPDAILSGMKEMTHSNTDGGCPS